MARDHAEAIRAEFGTAVDVMGVSSGGSVALQLAADHPDVVRRLIVVSAGYRLEGAAKEAQLRYVEAAAAGRRGAQYLAPVKIASPLGARLLAPLMWPLDPLRRPGDTADMVAFAHAEDAFDLGARLGEITAPTQVIAGRPGQHPLLTPSGTSTTPDVADVTEAGPAVRLRVSWARPSMS